MRTFLTTTALSVAFVASAGMASAATFTFGLDAEEFQDTEGFEGTFDQVYNDVDSVLFGGNTDGGVTVEAFATSHDNLKLSLDPFMDAESSQKIAGLGVCSTGFNSETTQDGSGAFGGMSLCSTQYDPSEDRVAGDDNLVFPEVLGLEFSLAVQITELLVRDADHNKFDGEIAVMTSLDISGGHPEYLDVIDGVVQDIASLGFSDLFLFSSAASCINTDPNGGQLDVPVCNSGTELYLTSLSATPVPLPAAGWLLLGGLGGMAAMKRRRKS